jgi:SNF2 family DNA or RNA helicase
MRAYSELFDYQQRAITYLYEHDHALALLPVGAGKSVIGWTGATELMDAGVVRRPLVFAPLRVAQLTWPSERQEWEHLTGRGLVDWSGEPAGWADSPWQRSRLLWGSFNNLEARIARTGDAQKRYELQTRLADISAEMRRVNRDIKKLEPPADLHVTSYENLMWLCELYEPGQSPFDLWILDEIGKLKNPKSARYKAVRHHTKEAPIVWGLNATPAPEGMGDMFTQVQIVDGGKLWGKSFYQWRQRYFMPTDYQGYNWRLQPGAFKRLTDDLNTLAFRADEADLGYQKNIRHTPVAVQLPPKAREAYDEMEARMLLEMDGQDDIIAMSRAAAAMKLRQITQGFIYDETGHAHTLHEEKPNALAELIEELGREPLLVAYEFAEDLHAIQRVWKNVPYLGQGVSAATARDHVEKWNKRELPILALHWMSAGHGLNLQHGGSHICWYGLPWSLEGFMQTNGRIDRQGQTRACFGHVLMAENTVDERVWSILAEKDADQASIIQAIRRI